MQTQRLLLLSFLGSLLLLLSGVQVSSGYRTHDLKNPEPMFKPDKLFVFGDSYSDTGNTGIAASRSWKPPYGMTFPGRPCGRFSNGRVLTDYVATFVGVRAPIPYRFRKIGEKYVKFGMNFAVGGTGVFEAMSPPNMTTQINFFQEQIKMLVYTSKDLQSSMALVTLAGNDYDAYGENQEGVEDFIRSVVNQLKENLKRINGLGVRKVAVTSMHPLGCLPRTTIVNNYKSCNETNNKLVGFHNQLLTEAVEDLNKQFLPERPFFILDLYTSFMAYFKEAADPGNPDVPFLDPLRPCCAAKRRGLLCGGVDERGEKQYTLCEDPKMSFFWDMDHPTEAGWKAVYEVHLLSTLKKYVG